MGGVAEPSWRWVGGIEYARRAFAVGVLTASAVLKVNAIGGRLPVRGPRAVVPGNAGIGAGYTYLTLQVVDVHAAHETLVGRGATELQTPSGERFASDSIVSFVADPDGNRIEISQRPDLVAALLRSDPRG